MSKQEAVFFVATPLTDYLSWYADGPGQMTGDDFGKGILCTPPHPYAPRQWIPNTYLL
jgi:hypothetical protein